MESGAHHSGVRGSALDLIGATPLVELARVHDGPGRILAKVEFVQPGGSVKDRPAQAIVEGARARGELAAGQPVVEMTSGNMGSGLALVCGVLGHPFIAVMSAGNSPARARMIEGLGAELVLTPQVDGKPGQVTGRDIAAAEEEARRVVAERGGFFANQFENPDSVNAHERGTGPEIESQAGGIVDAFVACIGTAATFVGTARHLKRANPAITCVAVEPTGAPVLAGERVTNPRHLLQGTGYARALPLWEPSLADAFMTVSDEEAREYRHLLATQEGLWVGYSSAANVCAAKKLLASGRIGRDAVVATVLCDTGLKY
jgi:cysteine synthase